METAIEKQRPVHSQIISVPHKDTVRILEVYVKRSLSLNDGSVRAKKAGKMEKWVTMPKRYRRSSSDPSLHLHEDLNPSEPSVLPVAEPQMYEPMKDPEKLEELEIKTKKSKKIKKLSFWKTFLGIFKNEDKEEDQDSPSEMFDDSNQATNCLPTTQISFQKKSIRKKSLRRKLSKRRSLRSIKFGKDVNSTDSTGVEAVISVEPTYAYYEKVSEEFEKIVHEVKEQEETEILSNEEVIKRIIALTIQEGDAIDGKLKDNPMLSSFFQRMSYSSFQKMADAYLEKEAMQTHKPPTVLPTAPELVKLAFTLDFTARVAGLSKQNVGHITCLGNRYLQDRFECRQACTDHPWSDDDVDNVPLTGK
ncbi:PREDICTED: uncharacterized protein LOC106920995 isoform X1 [Poecilia mexicana]|uniref:uncharacterized protein LOC106920995 isoform X1 n=1 Tax=Poecilia mexicana TaxID=48701 RepID=UPI00072E02F3|nr:PREDICTED: uncharacterized protein LOC106920995 isoform X1 [Poecilia mexicana]XP_014847867.1 PREDICTED: uncharacterized protein LOC106920995 isoform X1 [Poecilia mexicana]